MERNLGQLCKCCIDFHEFELEGIYKTIYTQCECHFLHVNIEVQTEYSTKIHRFLEKIKKAGLENTRGREINWLFRSSFIC